MNAYIESVIETVKKKHGNEPEFVQTVEEVLTSLDPVISAHPEYEAVDLLGRLVEPERMFTFRVVWTDDAGKPHTNIGYRCQFNGAHRPLQGRPALPAQRVSRHRQVPGLRADLQELPDRPAHRRRQGRLRL